MTNHQLAHTSKEQSILSAVTQTQTWYVRQIICVVHFLSLDVALTKAVHNLTMLKQLLREL